MANIEAAVEKIMMTAFAEGGPFELAPVKYTCGGTAVQHVGFKNCVPTLRQFYQKNFKEHASKEFIIFRNERYTFREVEARVNALGYELRHRYGIREGDRVAVGMRNYPEWCIAFLAASSIGAVTVPLNGWWKGEELHYGLTDSGSKVMVCDQERFERLLPILPRLPDLQLIVARVTKPFPNGVKATALTDILKAGAGKALTDAEVSLTPDSLANIMYTSGTTGHPKGVVHTHRGVCQQMMMGELGVYMGAEMAKLGGPTPKHQPCLLCPVPLFHVTASHHIFLASFSGGRKMVLMFKWDAGEALRLIEREKPHGWTGVPTMVQDLMNHPDFGKRDTSSLLGVGGGGAPTPTTQVNKVSKKFKNAAPSQGYGLTETNGAVCAISAAAYVAHKSSCGKAFPIASFMIADPDTLEVLGAEQRGELLIKSPLTMSHYWNKAKKTSDAIVSVPGHGDGWFRSGDVAKLDAEGFLYILDRVKDIIIRGGENISCAEVETAFYRNDSVHECAAFGIKDERLGEVVGLMVYFKAGATPVSAADLVNMVKQHNQLSAFKIPLEKNVFFTETTLPRGATGKILKRAIRDKINAALAAAAPKSKL